MMLRQEYPLLEHLNRINNKIKATLLCIDAAKLRRESLKGTTRLKEFCALGDEIDTLCSQIDDLESAYTAAIFGDYDYDD